MDNGPYTRPTDVVRSSSSNSSTSSSQLYPSPSQSQSQIGTQSGFRPSAVKKQRQPGEKPALRRNQACLSCRKRKLKCDAVRPTCGTCVRSHNYAFLHNKNKQIPSAMPSCIYEEESSVSTNFEPNSSALASASGSTSTSALALATISPTAGHCVNRAESLIPTISEFQGIQHQFPGISSEPSIREQGAKTDGYDYRAQSPTLTLGLTEPISSSWTHPVHITVPPPPPPLLSSSPSFKSLLRDIDQRPLSEAKPDTFLLKNPSDHLPYTERPNINDPSPYVPPIYQKHIGADQTVNPREQVAPKLEREFIEGESTGTFQEHIWTSSTADTPPRSATFGQSNKIETGLISINNPSEVLNDQTYDREKINLSANEEAEKANQVLMSLLYPGWPPHLPNPMMLEHIVESFFRYLASVAGIFNNGRFMARLTLAPSHHDFPHPAVLHAICAVTSRFLGIVSSTPPANTAFDGRKVEKPWSRSLLNPVDPKPVWDRLGPKPPGVLGGFFGRDGDFGQVHFSWGKLYIHDSKMFASEWIACIQALVILSHYCYQEARWIEAWSMIGDAAQMTSPLGLQTRKCHTFSTNPRRGPVSLLPPPKDEVEMTERQNLFICLFGLDTLAASTSGWAPAIDLSNMTSWILTALATVDPTHQPSCQDFQSVDLFSSHPAETTAYSLLVKSTILVRRVNDYVRLAAERDVDEPTETVEFKQLDRWTTDFRSTFPPALRDPFRPPATGDDGRSVDETLLSAHTNSLLAIIQLHDPYVNNSSPTDGSRTRIQEAVEYLLMMIHQLHATSFDLSTMHPHGSSPPVVLLGSSALVIPRLRSIESLYGIVSQYCYRHQQA
ncbi:Zn(2)-C6 fungal-type DNA-binding domain [Phaffia rhodozyma]|uniref:Zn(2)-C6 fungal-type DNA-binding domain n=1 Tax=Phaffia rhodozyma TaxID=264483 RepID=A0A0F7SVD9_PHARH|nr:Zn(2)-C6 fungal-type DNA-binding domain [Phaffia rhodozyma]